MYVRRFALLLHRGRGGGVIREKTGVAMTLGVGGEVAPSFFNVVVLDSVS